MRNRKPRAWPRPGLALFIMPRFSFALALHVFLIPASRQPPPVPAALLVKCSFPPRLCSASESLLLMALRLRPQTTLSIWLKFCLRRRWDLSCSMSYLLQRLLLLLFLKTDYYDPRGFPFSFLYLVLPTNDRTIKMMHAIFGLHVTEVSAMLHKTSYLFCVIVSALYAPVTMIIMYCMLSCQWFEIQS